MFRVFKVHIYRVLLSLLFRGVPKVLNLLVAVVIGSTRLVIDLTDLTLPPFFLLLFLHYTPSVILIRIFWFHLINYVSPLFIVSL